MMGYMNGMGLGGFGMMFWMFLKWGLLITGIYFLIRWISGGKAKSEDHALDILRERFAKAEISEEEFNHKKAILRA